MRRSDDWIAELHYKECINPTQKSTSKYNDLYYWEGDTMVMTEQAHLNRGYCCGSGCRHCPYFPKHQKFNKEVREESLSI